MTTREEVIEFGLTFEEAYLDTPFSDTNWVLVRFKGNKKAFIWSYMWRNDDGSEELRLNLKTRPDNRDFWRSAFEGKVIPGYHQNKEHWNTIILGDKCDKELVEELLELSYKLTSK